MLKKKPVRYKATGETDYTFLAHLPQTLFYKVWALIGIRTSNTCNHAVIRIVAVLATKHNGFYLSYR